MRARFAMLRDRANRKKIPFDLELDWLANFLEKNHYNPLYHAIDRICVLGGYIKSNLQIIDQAQNIAKGNRERHNQTFLL